MHSAVCRGIWWPHQVYECPRLPIVPLYVCTPTDPAPTRAHFFPRDHSCCRQHSGHGQGMGTWRVATLAAFGCCKLTLFQCVMHSYPWRTTGPTAPQALGRHEPYAHMSATDSMAPPHAQATYGIGAIIWYGASEWRMRGQSGLNPSCVPIRAPIRVRDRRVPAYSRCHGRKHRPIKPSRSNIGDV
jgi:hypothetical protein